MLMVEGPDGTGKTTLVEQLVKRGYRRHHHHHRDFDPQLTAFAYYTKLLLAARDEKTVFDRLYPSEYVYGPVMRGSRRITLEQLRLLNRLFFSLGGHVIFCDTDSRAILRNWQTRQGQEYLDGQQKLRDVVIGYRQLSTEEFTAYNQTVYDYQSEFGQWFINEIRGREVPYCSVGTKLPAGVIGSPLNKFLFVGERSSEEIDLAFYSDRQSAHFLNECLWDAGYKEHELAFTNALTPGVTQRNIYAIWQVKPDQVVITLGKVAAQTAVDQAVPHLEAPHPQYIKRFHLKERSNYVELLNRFRGGL